MARGFAEAGADVFITSRHEEELRVAADEIRRGLEVKVEYAVVDMLDRKAVAKLANDATARPNGERRARLPTHPPSAATRSSTNIRLPSGDSLERSWRLISRTCARVPSSPPPKLQAGTR